jgi:hypothetical protein
MLLASTQFPPLMAKPKEKEKNADQMTPNETNYAPTNSLKYVTVPLAS